MWCITRIRLGVSIGSEAYRPTLVKSPLFGKRKKEALQWEGEQLAAAALRSAELRARTNGVSEDDAWAAVSRRFEFAMKPAWHSWSSFLEELERYEMQWSLLSPYVQHYNVVMRDHMPSIPSANGDSAVTLFSLSTHESRSAATSDLLRTLCDMHTTGIPLHFAHFADSGIDTSLELETYLHKDCPVEAPVEETYLWRKAAQRQLTGSPAPHLIGEEHTSCGLTVNIDDGAKSDLPATSSKELATVAARDQSPWVCVRGRLNDFNGSTTPMLFDMSLQGYTSVVLRAWVTFLNSEFCGVRCYNMVARTHMTRDLCPMWKQLRSMAKMHDSPWPIDPSLLPD